MENELRQLGGPWLGTGDSWKSTAKNTRVAGRGLSLPMVAQFDYAAFEAQGRQGKRDGKPSSDSRRVFAALPAGFPLSADSK